MKETLTLVARGLIFGGAFGASVGQYIGHYAGNQWQWTIGLLSIGVILGLLVCFGIAMSHGNYKISKLPKKDSRINEHKISIG